MQSADRCPFSPEEIVQYRAFEAYDFDGDAEFRAETAAMRSLAKQEVTSVALLDDRTTKDMQAKLAYYAK